jgi:multidrug efflux pump
VATVLTLVVTPSLLALRVWFWTYVNWVSQLLASLSLGRSSRAARDWALRRAARRTRSPELIWPIEDEVTDPQAASLRAAE